MPASDLALLRMRHSFHFRRRFMRWMTDQLKHPRSAPIAPTVLPADWYHTMQADLRRAIGTMEYPRIESESVNVRWNEVIETDNGLSCVRAIVTSIQVRHESDGTTSLVMTDGQVSLRLFASASQIDHLVRVLHESVRTP